MSIPGKLEIDRAGRKELDRWATLRDSAMQPHDILVEDLSATGCKILVNIDLPIDMLVRVGLSGAGTRPARIVRGSQPIYGCAFVDPMSDDDIRRAARADTVVAAEFSSGAGPASPPPDVKTIVAEGMAGLPLGTDAAAKPKRRIPFWVDAIALFLIFLFAIHVWGMIPRAR